MQVCYSRVSLTFFVIYILLMDEKDEDEGEETNRNWVSGAILLSTRLCSQSKLPWFPSMSYLGY